MYVPTQPIMLSCVTKEGGGIGTYELWPSNGSYTRTPKGKMAWRVSRKEPRLLYRCETDQGNYHGSITDKVLVGRIMEYMRLYYGKQYTNCSAFAHFLTTGTFVECSPERRLLVLEQGMHAYTGQKVRVGDMLCVVYAKERRMRSRKIPWRPAYMKAKKERHRDGRFGHALSLKRKSVTAEEVWSMYQKDVLVEDYHFLVCVGKHNCEPVWISQQGRFHPAEEDSPIILTVGEYDGYPFEIPLFTFFKRRR